MEKDERALSSDHIAVLSLGGNDAFHEMRSAYENDLRLHVPQVIRSYAATGVENVRVAEDE